MSGAYLEDFAVGEVITSGEDYEMTPERIHEFANEYDPQSIHLDPAVAEHEFFGGIIASGWHSLSVTMRLMVRANVFGGAPVIGVSVDSLRYLAPVNPGDRLSARAEVLETRPSGNHPERGYLVLRVTTWRHDGTQVLTQDWTVLVPRRELIRRDIRAPSGA